MPKEKTEKGYHALPEVITKYLDSSESPNLSLKYYKWANIYNETFSDKIKDKGIFLHSFVKLSENPVYTAAFDIRKKYFEKMRCTSTSFPMTTASRLMFGIGYDHPTEIGFMFDWTTGLPVIPGSSLKGAAREAAREAGWLPKDITEIFGKEMKHGEKESQSGRIVFLPAYPVINNKRVFLDLDVMTPHYSEYYQKPQDNPPADYYSPEPHKFLTVPAGIKYQFCLLDRVEPENGQSAELKKAEAILKTALKDFGVGAKTNVFYGYFNEPSKLDH